MEGKSQMGEDSVLLKPRSDQSRKISKENTFQENWTLFKEYYFKKLLLLLVVLAVAIWVIVDVVNNQTTGLSVMMIDVYCAEEDQELFTKAVEEALEIDPDEEYVYLAYDITPEVMVTRVAAADLDIFLMDEAAFAETAGKEWLYDLSALLEPEEYEQLEAAGDICLYGDQALGLKVTDSEWLGQFGFTSKDEIILGIVCNSKHIDRCENLLHLIK